MNTNLQIVQDVIKCLKHAQPDLQVDRLLIDLVSNDLELLYELSRDGQSVNSCSICSVLQEVKDLLCYHIPICFDACTDAACKFRALSPNTWN